MTSGSSSEHEQRCLVDNAVVLGRRHRVLQRGDLQESNAARGVSTKSSKKRSHTSNEKRTTTVELLLEEISFS